MSDTITLPREVVQEALEALERSVATCFSEYDHREVLSDPKHFVNQAIEALRKALAAEPTKQEALCWFCHGTGYQKNPVYPALVPCPNCKPKEYFK